MEVTMNKEEVEELITQQICERFVELDCPVCGYETKMIRFFNHFGNPTGELYRCLMCLTLCKKETKVIKVK